MVVIAAAETARLIASLELRDKLSKGVQNAQTNLGKFESRWDKLGSKLKTGLAIGAGGLAVFGVQQIREGLASLTEVENAVTQVNGALGEVAPTWNTTGAEIARIADRIEGNVQAAFDDKDIIKGAGALIRYGKLSEKNLEPALEVMTDLAAKTGSVESASTLLAKALADPAKAASMLRRQGVILTKQQQDQIKVMVEAGDTAGAQALLLENLARTTRGSARDLFGPAADAQNELNDAVEDGQKVFAQGFLPVIQRVREALGKGLADPATMGRIRDLGQSLADGFSSLLDIAGKVPWGTIGDSLALAGQGAKAVLGAFTSMPPWVQTAVVTAWGLNKVSGGLISDLGKGLIKGVLGMSAGVVNIKAAVVNGGGGLPGGPGAPGFSWKSILAAIGVVGITTAFSDWATNNLNNSPEGQAAGANFQMPTPGIFGDLPAMAHNIAEMVRLLQDPPAAPPVADRTLDGIEDVRAGIGTTTKTVTQTADEIRREHVTQAGRLRDQELQTGLQAHRAGETAKSGALQGAQIVSSSIAANRPVMTTNIDIDISGATVATSVNTTNRSGWKPPSSKSDRSGELEF